MVVLNAIAYQFNGSYYHFELMGLVIVTVSKLQMMCYPIHTYCIYSEGMPLTEEELDEVCQVVHPVLFRVGVLLGVSVAGIEKVLGEVDREPWGVARCVIEEFRMNCDQQDERYVPNNFDCRYLEYRIGH